MKSSSSRYTVTMIQSVNKNTCNWCAKLMVDDVQVDVHSVQESGFDNR